MAGIIGFGLAGCAGESTLKQGSYPAAVAPYEGVFAGEFVDGKPLYRLPTIEVVGSRRRGAEGT